MCINIKTADIQCLRLGIYPTQYNTTITVKTDNKLIKLNNKVKIETNALYECESEYVV